MNEFRKKMIGCELTQAYCDEDKDGYNACSVLAGSINQYNSVHIS